MIDDEPKITWPIFMAGVFTGGFIGIGAAAVGAMLFRGSLTKILDERSDSVSSQSSKPDRTKVNPRTNGHPD